MAASIDEKVVEMRFDNRQFEKGVQQSINSINNLNKAADFTASQKGVKDLQNSFSKFNLGNAIRGVESFSLKVSALGVAGAEVVRRITDSAIDLGKKITGVIAKPIELAKSGGIARALNIEQAKFQLEGLDVEWNKIEKDISYGVKDTAYGLDAAAKAASQLVASNVHLGTEMKASLRGISGVAAMTNSSYEDISNIFTTVAGNGKLMTMELRQLSSRGLNVAATLGKELGKTETEIREMVTKGEIDFKTFAKAMDDAFGQHAKDANKTFEGAMSNVKASLSRIGATFAGPIYTEIVAPLNALKGLTGTIEEAIKGPGEQFAKFAKQVSAFFTALMSNEHVVLAVKNATIGVVNLFKFGAKIFRQVADAFMDIFPPKTVEQIQEASAKFRSFTSTLKLTERQIEIIKAVAKGVFAAFKIFGTIIKGVKLAIKGLIDSPVGEFFGDLVIKISNAVVKLSDIFEDLVNADDSLITSIKRAIDIVKPFGGTISAVGDMIHNVFSKITEEAEKMFSALPEGLKNVLDAFNHTNDGINKSVSDSLAYKFIHGLGIAFKTVATIIVTAAHGIFNALSNVLSIVGREGGFGELLKDLFAASIWQQVQKLIKTVRGSLNIVQSFSGVLNATRGALIKYQKMLSARMILNIAIAIGVLAASLYVLAQVPGKRVATALGGIAGAAIILSVAFMALQKSLKDDNILSGMTMGPKLIMLATSILIMAAALRTISKLNITQIGTALAGIAGVVTLLVVAAKALSTKSSKAMKGTLQMIALAAAIKSLAKTLKSLADLDIKQIGVGLAGIGGMLLSLAAFSRMMNSIKVKPLTAVSIAIIIMSLKTLATEIAEMGQLSFDVIARGVGAIGALLAEIAATALILSQVRTSGLMDMIFAMGSISKGMVVLSEVVNSFGSMDPDALERGVFSLGIVVAEISALAAVLNHNRGILKATVAIRIMADAMVVLSDVVEAFGDMRPQRLIRGLTAVAAVIVELSGALMVMSHQKHTLAASVALFNLALSIKVLSGTVQTFGHMSWDEIARGLTGLAGALGALTTAALLMRKGVLGAASLTIMAAALIAIVPVLLTIGTMPWDGILKSVTAIGSVFAILVTSAAVAKPLAAGFAIISRALLSFAASMIGVGGGMFLFAAAVDMLLSAKARLMSVQADFLKIAVSAGKALIGFIKSVVKGLAQAADSIAGAVTKIVVAIIRNIRKAIPALVKEAYKMMIEFIKGFADGAEKYIPKFLKAVQKLIKKVAKAIGGYFKEFDGLGGLAIAKIAGIAVAITLIFKSIANSISGISSVKGIAAALVIVAGIVSIAGSLLILASQPWDGLIAAAASMSLVLLAMSKAMQMISNTEVSLASIGLFAAGAVAIAAIGASLSLIANANWASLLAGAASITAVLYAYTAVFELLSKTKVSAKTLLNIGIFAAGTLALAPIVLALKILASEDYKSLLTATVALTSTMVAVGVLFGVMSVLPTAAVIGAVGNLAVAIGGLGLILAALGAIKQIPGVEWLVNEGAEFANTIGGAIGGFVGSIVAGFGKALSSLLPQIGSDLAAFWENAAPFFDGVAAVGTDTMNAVQALATALLTLTATELIQGIASFFGADVDFKGFGKQLSDFADGMIEFAEKTAGLNAEDVEKAANAAAMLGEFASSVPLKGGLLSDLIGDRDLEGFANSLPLLGDGLAKFAEKTKKLDTDAVDAATNSAKMLAELNQNIPLQGGLLGDLMGNKDLGSFGEQLPKLGKGLAKFGNNTKKLDNGAIQKATTTAKMLAELNQNIPLEGGLLGDLMGNKDLASFGRQLPTLGKGLKKFADKTTGMDIGAATSASIVAQMLAALAADIPNEGGIVSWFTGDSSLEDFGEQLPDFGKNVKKFGNQIKGIDIRATGTVSGMLNTVVNLLKFANQEGISASYVSDFSAALNALGAAYKQFMQDAGSSSVNLNAFADGMDRIIKTIKKINKVNTTKIKSFTEDLRGLTEAGLNDVKTASERTVDSAIDALKLKKEEFKTVGNTFVDQTRIGIAINGHVIKEALVKACSNAADAINSDTQQAKYAASGKFFVDGFVKGMDNDERIQDVIKAAKRIAEAAKNGVNDGLKIESPSKVMMESGEYVVEGLAEGIEDNSDVVDDAATSLSKRVDSAMTVDTNKAKMKGKKVVDAVKSGAETAADKVTGWFGGLADKIGIGESYNETLNESEKAGEDTGKAAAEGVASETNVATAEESGKKIGSSAAKGVKVSAVDMKKALEAYKYIMGNFAKSYDKFSKKYLETSITKKGLGQLKINSKYLLSGINDKYLRTAAMNMGSNIVNAINKGMRNALKKDKSTADILSSLDEAGQNLVKARKRRNKLQSTIDNKNSSAKEVEKARKLLKLVNADIEKYQKQVEKYKNKLKDTGKSVAKSVTSKAIGELTNTANEFKKIFNKMGDKTGNYLYKIPSVLSSYISSVRSSALYAKDVVASVEKVFGSNIEKMDATTKANISKLEKKLSDAEEARRKANKVLNDDKASKKEQKAAEKQLKKAEKTIANISTKLAAERKKLTGSAVVDKFAERLYYNSESYQDEVNQVKASTKKIKKIRAAAAKAEKNLKKATKEEDKKKYANELKELKKQYEEEEKILQKSASNIAKGPAKALKAFKLSLKETLKSMLAISSLDFTPRIKLEGFDKFEKSTNLVEEATAKFDVFAAATQTAGQKFSIFGDLSKKTTKSFELFNGAVSTGINLLERFTKVGSVEKQALFENADSQLEAYEEFYKGIEELRERGLGDAIVDDLKSQGPSALNYIRGFLSMTNAELESYNDRITKMSAYGAANYTNELKASMKKAQKFTSGLEELATLGLKQEVIDEFKEMGADSAQGYIDSLLAGGEDSIRELNSMYKEYAKESSRSLLEAAEEQYKASLKYDEIINELKKTVLDPSIIKDIEDMGHDEAIAYANSILSNLDEIPALNELYWKSQSGGKTMVEQMQEANNAYSAFETDLGKLKGYGVDKAFLEYIEGLGLEEGNSVLQRALSEFGSLSDEFRARQVQLFNDEYKKSLKGGKTPAEVLLENLKTQNEGYDEYNKNLDKVLQQLGGDEKSTYFKYLKEMGMDGAEYVEALANATTDQIQQYRKMIDEREERNRKEQTKSILDSWQAEIDTVKNYANNMATLIKRGASQTLVDDLASMDIKEAASKVEALLGMDETSWNDFNKSYKETMEQNIGDMVNSLTGVFATGGEFYKSNGAKMAKKQSDGYNEGMVEGAESMIQSEKDAHNQAALAVYPTIQENSKKAGADSASYFAASVALGTLASTPRLKESGNYAGRTVSEAFSENLVPTIARAIGDVPAKAIVKAFKKGLKNDDVTQKIISSGEAICNGVITGISSKSNEVVVKATEVASGVYTQFETYISYAKAHAITTAFCTAIYYVLTSKRPVLFTAAQNCGASFMNGINWYVNYNNGYYWGSQMLEGLIRGMEDQADRAEAAAERLASSVNSKFTKFEKIESPSKVWAQFGMYLGEGLANGMSDSTELVSNAAKDMAIGANSELQQTLANIRDGINSELDLNPVIKPILDLSKVSAKAQAINSMMENTTIGATIHTTNGDDETNQNGGVTYNFEQNNYSPKALSTLEIYRQTRNQFAMAKEALY